MASILGIIEASVAVERAVWNPAQSRLYYDIYIYIYISVYVYIYTYIHDACLALNGQYLNTFELHEQVRD